ncbi:YjzD family protein [Kurthia massiliensis]|jgi:cytochrome c oxidase subunit IV|uniref:YjzD family protein n=1 Tax=Kurthia massiliensis TaxID=1033739 RepID=UPI0002881BCD|nr:YjzD family protein [Kurthia massiliensis]
MRYIFLVIWSVILVSVLNYVVSAINNAETIDWTQGLIMSLVFAVLLIIVDTVIPSKSPKAIGHDEH